MIPVKLVETVFRRSWALLLPVVLVPLLVLGLTAQPPRYQSQAIVWVSSPVAGTTDALGYSNPYLTPAQNQAQSLNDLLSTRAFREEVAREAGLLRAGSSEDEARRVLQRMSVYTGSAGVNLLSVSAIADGGKEAQAIVNAVITRYRARATAEIQRETEVAATYYTQQIGAATQNLAQRKTELTEYLQRNPKAADPNNAASLDPDYRALLERVDSQNTVVENLRRALEATQLQGATAPQTLEAAFTVQDSPREPEAPLPTSMTSALGYPFAGLVFGLLIGLTYIYLTYRTDHTIRTPADLAKLNVPLLGTVPQLSATPPWARFAPVSWIVDWRRRDFARKTAASIGNPNQPAASGTEA